MSSLRRLVSSILLFVFGNFLLFNHYLPKNYEGFQFISDLDTRLSFGVLIVIFILFNLFPIKKQRTKRLTLLAGGYELLISAFLIMLYELVLYIILYRTNGFLFGEGSHIVWVNLIIFSLMVFLILVNGFFRTITLSKHLRFFWRLMMMVTWWIPLFNIYMFTVVLSKVRREFLFESKRLKQREIHINNLDCQTRYPIVMVHGIFFRDWQYLGYWGRVPEELENCGAKIYYGKQQSSLPIPQSAAELKESLEQILAETGAEKVNIIAHSKGGLDCRYAITVLGMAPYVASLTTINTPHRGCIFVSCLFDCLPGGLIRFVEKRYNAFFTTLGDTAPDFVGGVTNLRHDRLAVFNKEVPDSPEVYYQSYMSVMRKSRSALFPLNVTWWLSKIYEKEPNDGLVAASSAQWGTFKGLVTVSGKRGISHGDMIDLMREDIPGFDVREFYINLVKELKAIGF